MDYPLPLCNPANLTFIWNRNKTATQATTPYPLEQRYVICGRPLLHTQLQCAASRRAEGWAAKKAALCTQCQRDWLHPHRRQEFVKRRAAIDIRASGEIGAAGAAPPRRIAAGPECVFDSASTRSGIFRRRAGGRGGQSVQSRSGLSAARSAEGEIHCEQGAAACLSARERVRAAPPCASGALSPRPAPPTTSRCVYAAPRGECVFALRAASRPPPRSPARLSLPIFSAAKFGICRFCYEAERRVGSLKELRAQWEAGSEPTALRRATLSGSGIRAMK